MDPKAYNKNHHLKFLILSHIFIRHLTNTTHILYSVVIIRVIVYNIGQIEPQWKPSFVQLK